MCGLKMTYTASLRQVLTQSTKQFRCGCLDHCFPLHTIAVYRCWKFFISLMVSSLDVWEDLPIRQFLYLKKSSMQNTVSKKETNTMGGTFITERDERFCIRFDGFCAGWCGRCITVIDSATATKWLLLSMMSRWKWRFCLRTNRANQIVVHKILQFRMIIITEHILPVVEYFKGEQ